MSAPKSILITGGGSGIGAALAERMAQRGCGVVISGRRSEALASTAAGHANMVACSGDVTDPTHRAELHAALAATDGPRAIFHAAGYFQIGLLEALSDDDWTRSFETNVTARWQLSHQCLDLLYGGRLLFIGSDAGLNPRPAATAYSIAQSASETLWRSLQIEWADHNVAVTGFKPGLVNTEMVRGFMSLAVEQFPSLSAYEQYVSSGQIAEPEVIARFAEWLLVDVDEGRYVTTEWDIRHPEHHREWSDGPLYPNASNG